MAHAGAAGGCSGAADQFFGCAWLFSFLWASQPHGPGWALPLPPITQQVVNSPWVVGGEQGCDPSDDGKGLLAGVFSQSSSRVSWVTLVLLGPFLVTLQAWLWLWWVISRCAQAGQC